MCARWRGVWATAVLLTVFAKTRNVETAEVQRALRAQKTCEADHGIAHDSYERKVT